MGDAFKIRSWCETPPGSSALVQCGDIPIYNANKLYNLPIDRDLDVLCEPGDILVWNGVEWSCGTGPTGSFSTATGFLTVGDCRMVTGTGIPDFPQSVYTRINNINTVAITLAIRSVGTGPNIAVGCDFPSLPPHGIGMQTPGALGAIAATFLGPLLVSGNVFLDTATSITIEFMAAAPLDPSTDTIESQCTFSWVS